MYGRSRQSGQSMRCCARPWPKHVASQNLESAVLSIYVWPYCPLWCIAFSRLASIYKPTGWLLSKSVMAFASLNQFRRLRLILTGLRRRWLQWRTGVTIHPSASISLSSRFITGRRGAITVGADTLIAFKTLIDARDASTGEIRPIKIGERCFIGGSCTIMPGVNIDNEVIVAAGAVVFHDVPSNSIVAGNPAKIIRKDIKVGKFGRLPFADENTRSMWII